MLGRLVGILAIASEHPRRRERWNLHAQADECVPVSCEVLRVRHAIALDVGSSRILWVRPPVVSFGKVIMLAARAAGARGICNRDRTLVEILLCLPENVSAFKFCQIERHGRGAVALSGKDP